MANVANGPDVRLSAPRAAKLPENTAESPSRAATSLSVDPFESIGSAQPDQGRFERLAIPVIVLFWGGQFVWFSLDRWAREPEIQDWPYLQARLIVTAVGALLSFGILKVLQRSSGASFMSRALLAIALALVAASINSIVNQLVFWAIIGPAAGETASVSGFLPSLPSLVYFFSWFYLAIAVILLSLTYGEELLQRERRIGELRRDADRARLVALRYQLNPHFLFNALNSAASLVSSRRNSEAELMLENLADFLRATLELDAGKEIPLRDELGLQSLYLGVEETRFPHRLRVEKDIPEELLDVVVPNLITQPLIENTIKHAVARSTRPVSLQIAAREVGGKLHINVRDDGGDAGTSARNGVNIGLRNVAKRLRLHFGDDAEFEAAPTAEGGFETRIVMPIRRRR